MKIVYEFRIRQVERQGVECFIAALLYNETILAHTITLSEAGAKTWIESQRNFVSRMTRYSY